ncbi:hypothetical protein [Halobacillus naozhouensis]|uniref:Uncharacterized protein n=2 Tax=Halobacillus naozhouensis TaxID=554880 RepID=A0ABY8IU53_9BACI|nr:hypothetical protein [Halobacillus naozhouensis]WFT73623.1 hypothetical protein P9989_14750 [Halobacillus naozhouensis]
MVYLYALILFWIFDTIDTFFIEEKWFDFIFSSLTMVAIAGFTYISLKKHKKFVTVILCILFIAYLYEAI